MKPFVDQRPPEPVWFFCCDCHTTYDGRDGHLCRAYDPDDGPLDAAEGIILALLGMAVVYAVVLALLDRRFGWPF